MTASSILQTIDNAAAYTWGNCTYYVAKIANWIPAGLGNAGDWLANARRQGLQTSSTPSVGSVVVYAPGSDYSQFGHVAYVTGVHPGGSFDVTEMNFRGLNVVDTRTSNLADVLGFILPPSGAGATAPAAPAPASTSPSSSPASCSITDFGCWMGILQTDLMRGFWIAIALGLALVGVVLLVVEDVESKLGDVAPAAAKGVAENPEVLAA